MLYNSLRCNPAALKTQVRFAHLPRSKALGLQKLPVQSVSDKGWFIKDLKLLKHWVMRVSLPNNLALEKQKFIFLRYNFKVTRLNKEYRYCRHNGIKLARRKCISIVQCISRCPACAVQELEFRRKAWWWDSCETLPNSAFHPTCKARAWNEWHRVSINLNGHLRNEKGNLALGICCDYRERHIFKMPLSTRRAAAAAPSSRHCDAPRPGSQQWVKLVLQRQDRANRLWLPIKLMLFIKNVFSITHSSSHPDTNVPEIFQGQLCMWTSLSPISKPLNWLLFLPLGLEQSCPFKAPGGSHFPLTVLSGYAQDCHFSIFVWNSSFCAHLPPYRSFQ